MKKNIMLALLLAIGLGQMAPVMAMEGENSPSSFSSGSYSFNPSSPLYSSSSLEDDHLRETLRLQLASQRQNDNVRGFSGARDQRDRCDRQGNQSSRYDEKISEDEVVEQRTYRDVIQKQRASDYYSDPYREIKHTLSNVSFIKNNSEAIAGFFAIEVQEDEQSDVYNIIVNKFIQRFCDTVEDQYGNKEFVLKFDYIKNLNNEELQSQREMVINSIKNLFFQHFNYLNSDFTYYLFQYFEVTSEVVQKIVEDPKAFFVLLIAMKKYELEQQLYLSNGEKKRKDQYSRFLEDNVNKISLDVLNLQLKNVSSPSVNVGFASLGVAAASLTKDVMASYNKEVKKLLAEKQQKAEADKKFKGKRITLTRSEKARCALAMLQKHTNPKNIKANKMFWAAAVVALGSLLYNKTPRFKMPEFSMSRSGGHGEGEYVSAGNGHHVGSESHNDRDDNFVDQRGDLGNCQQQDSQYSEEDRPSLMSWFWSLFSSKKDEVYVDSHLEGYNGEDSDHEDDNLDEDE